LVLFFKKEHLASLVLGNTMTNRLVAVAAAILLPAAASASTLSVYIDKSSPTAAADQQVAEAVAAREQATLATFRFDGSGDDDGFDVKDFRTLLAGKCDLVMGFPTEAADAAVPEGLAATAPYGSTGFVLVLADGVAGTSLDDLPEGTEVAVTYGTAPNLFLVQHPKLKPDLLTTDAETAQTLASGEVKAAMLWRPTFAASATKAHFTEHPLSEAHSQFNLVALRASSAPDVARAFDTAVAALQKSGELARILGPHGVQAPAGAGAPSTHAGIANPLVVLAGYAAPASPGGPPPALYSAAQATQGAQKFADNCSQCHGDNLEGLSGPALTGANFASEKAAFKVGDIFTILTNNMPATAPGSLAHDDYVQIMAFLLQKNGYPAGSSELKFDEATKSAVPFLYRAP